MAERLKRILEPHLQPEAALMIIVEAAPLGEDVEDIDLLLLGGLSRIYTVLRPGATKVSV